MSINNIPEKSVLGKITHYTNYYDPEQLFPISRQAKRNEIGVTHALPFFGIDIWNHYEVSWLNPKGKPVVALAEIIYDCASENIIESKSMKLYFNSFNNTKFNDVQAVQTTIQNDLQQRLKTSFIEVRIQPLQLVQDEIIFRRLEGIYLDDLDIECVNYHTCPDYLITEEEQVEEVLNSDLLKSNCLVTNQPDWCSIQIAYKGKKINHAGLLRYLVSFRNENEFHEQCIEKIFMHILQRCQPNELTVYGRSTRRGGLDINSYRSTKVIDLEKIRNARLCRQ
ncbi:MAG: NADPH-dependent 7-cyano-7-deazaguanine reductase QueF [Gammaproteobacteria bacterium]|nr:NADPH-dependent 7-cyano-7-deazaguanine reductase QueF [Gammaproteobacteria bacterium]